VGGVKKKFYVFTEFPGEQEASAKFKDIPPKITAVKSFVIKCP
jgi:hypothetical protein